MSKIHPEQLQLQQPQKQTKSVQNNFNSSFRNQEYQQYRCDSEIDLEHQITVWNWYDVVKIIYNMDYLCKG